MSDVNVRDSIQNQFGEMAKLIYTHFPRLAAKLRLRSLYHYLVDKFEGIDTCGDVMPAEIGFHVEIKYGPGGWWDLKMALGKTISAGDVFVDFGSGKGRMVFLAARYYPFRTVIGIEISDKLNDIAQQNIKNNMHKLLCTDVQLVNSDVSNYAIPDNVTVVYIYDPFRGATFVDLIKRLRVSLNRCPREMRIIYRQPAMHDRLIENGFALEFQKGELSMYKGTSKSPNI